MGNSSSRTTSNKSTNVCFAANEDVFNMQQNMFSNYILLDIRTENEYNKSHIDGSHHLKFAHLLSSNSANYALHKKWLQQIVKLHQSSYSKSKIQFFIIDNANDDNAMSLIQNVCKWLNDLNADKVENISQIDTSQYFYVNFKEYKEQFPFMCSDHLHYTEGRLFPSKINENIYLSNWGIASDGNIFRILDGIKFVINCTFDHPNIFCFDDDAKQIYSEHFINEQNENGLIQNAMLQRQNDQINAMRNEFSDVRLNYLRVPIIDNRTNNVYAYFEQSCRFIADGIESANKILIHCRHGQSRSVSICAAWLIANDGMSADDALAFIKRKRPRINPNDGFVKQLNEWSDYCKNKQNMTMNMNELKLKLSKNEYDKMLNTPMINQNDKFLFVDTPNNKENERKKVSDKSIDCTDWMKERIESLLIDLKFNDGQITITKFIKIDGFATILQAQNECKYGFDFWFDCEWNGRLNGKECKGRMRMDDVASDEAMNEWIYQIEVDDDGNGNNQKAKEIMIASKGIVLNAINAFVKEFNEININLMMSGS